MAGQKVALTSQRIETAVCPPEKRQLLVWDAVQPGLVLRVYPTGRKVFLAFYRVGSGRKAPQRWDQIGDASAVSLKDARESARAKLGAVAKGGDPAGERRAEVKRRRSRLKPALERYERDLERRQVVKRKEVMSLLRRELLGPVGNVDLGSLTRNDLVSRIAEVEASGRPGAARELRKVGAVFLGWCADHGIVSASPLAGWRRQRKTRAERVQGAGRSLADWEIPIFWNAAGASGFPFGPYLQILLLLMQRRTETSLMRYRQLDLTAGVWTVPPEITKSGRPHKIPLPAPVVDLIRPLPRMRGTDLVFPGSRNKPLAGWSKRLPDVYERTAEAGIAHWTPHDLRRTARSGLSALGVDRVVAELLLDHAISNELAAIYDRHDYWPQRVDASARWSNHVVKLIEGNKGTVLAFDATAG